MTLEQARLDDERERGIAWKKWGPYLSERQGELCARTTVKTATHGLLYA